MAYIARSATRNCENTDMERISNLNIPFSSGLCNERAPILDCGVGSSSCEGYSLELQVCGMEIQSPSCSMYEERN